jgi:peptidoglycan/xylan/chitin deacetylase (PgdA/CDA1 family)
MSVDAIMKSALLLLLCCAVVSCPLYSQGNSRKNLQLECGGIIRTDRSKQEIHLVFTGHEFADGGDHILKVLRKHGVKASFFFTGDFYRTSRFSDLIATLKKEGHYLGAHSDKHLLYCTWEKRDSLLVTKDSFQRDLNMNYREMKKFHIDQADARYFLPPYEWYNDSISAWTKELGLTLVNFTPGTYSNADWTHPELGNQYLSSDTIYARILRYESTRPQGLNGFLLLTHIGTDPRREDKFYRRLDDLITTLLGRGYRFASLEESIN